MSRWSDREAVKAQIDATLAASEAGTLEEINRKAREIRAENARRAAAAS